MQSINTEENEESEQKKMKIAFLNKVVQLWRATFRSLSPVQLFVTPRTVAHQAPLSMGFSRQEY